MDLSGLRRDSSLLKGLLQATKVNFVLLVEEIFLNWNRSPVQFQGYLFSHAIWLLKNMYLKNMNTV